MNGCLVPASVIRQGEKRKRVICEYAEYINDPWWETLLFLLVLLRAMGCDLEVLRVEAKSLSCS